MTWGWRYGAALVCACGSIVAAGCQDDVTTVFPPGLEPLEDNAAPPPPGGPSSEEIMLVSSDGEHKWVHGRGYIQVAPSVVWAASKDPERMVADCDTTRHAATVGTEPEYEYGFEMSYEVDDILNVAWIELWRYGTIEGVVEAPTFTMIRYQKVFGSDFITNLEGSAIFRATDVAGRTELEFIEHLTALGGNVDNMKRSMQHRFDTLLAVVHGRDIPPCP